MQADVVIGWQRKSALSFLEALKLVSPVPDSNDLSILSPCSVAVGWFAY